MTPIEWILGASLVFGLFGSLVVVIRKLLRIEMAVDSIAGVKKDVEIIKKEQSIIKAGIAKCPEVSLSL